MARNRRGWGAPPCGPQGPALAPLILFVVTSAWSMAFRRDVSSIANEGARSRSAPESDEGVVSTAIVLQELLQGFAGPRDRGSILERFAAVRLLVPDRDDHVQAAELRDECRHHGIRLCLRHELTMLTTDRDFERLAAATGLRIWDAPRSPQAGTTSTTAL